MIFYFVFGQLNAFMFMLMMMMMMMMMIWSVVVDCDRLIVKLTKTIVLILSSQRLSNQ